MVSNLNKGRVAKNDELALCELSEMIVIARELML